MGLTLNAEIKSGMHHELSQPGAPQLGTVGSIKPIMIM